MNKAAILTTGIILGAAGVAAIGISKIPDIEKKARHMKQNVMDAAEAIGSTVNEIKELDW